MKIHELDSKTISWFLRYLKAVKKHRNEAGFISDAAALRSVIDDVEWNISRGTPSQLVIMGGE